MSEDEPCTKNCKKRKSKCLPCVMPYSEELISEEKHQIPKPSAPPSCQCTAENPCCNVQNSENIQYQPQQKRSLRRKFT